MLTLVAEQSAPAAKADIPQGPSSVMRNSKGIAESDVKPRARKPLVAANKNSKAASKPSRRRVQVVLTHAKEEKENLPHVSSDSDDEIDDPLVHARSTQKTPSKRQGHWSTIIDALPDPFVLTSSDEFDDPLEGGRSGSKGPTAGVADKVEGITTKDSGAAPVTSAETTDAGNPWALKSCLRAADAPSKGHTVRFKESLVKFHFYCYPDPDDIWSRCGLPMRLTRKSFTSILLIFGDSPASYSETPETSYLLIKGSPCYMDWIQASTVFWRFEHFVTTFT